MLPSLALVCAFAAQGPGLVTIEGNVALPEQLYLTVLESRAPAGFTPEGGVEALTSFLRDSGYELATVELTSREPLVYRVEEGRLDRILFIGAGGGTTLGFKLSFSLPGDVFNRSAVDQEVQRLVRESGSISGARWELARARAVEPRNPELQISGERKLGTVTVLEPGHEYELRIFLEQAPWRPGFDLGIGFGPPDGLSVNMDWRLGEAFVEDDRLDVSSSVGVDFGDLSEDPSDRLGLTRLGIEARWFTPPLGANWLRSFASLSAMAFGRDREEDIGVDSYIFAPLAASANVQFEFDRLSSYIGGGLEQRFILRARATEDPDLPQPQIADLDPPANLRPFLAFGTAVTFGPSRLRQDRRHRAQFDARILGAGTPNTDGIFDVRASYENTFLFGWDELRYSFRGAYLAGDVPYFNEVAFGDGFVRAAFLDEIFTRRVGTLKLEYRLSLSRDTVKVSLFNDFGVFERLNLARESEGARLIENGGVGVHLLVLDVFQVDLYGGVGVTSDGDAGVDLSLSVNQVF